MSFIVVSLEDFCFNLTSKVGNWFLFSICTDYKNVRPPPIS